MPADSNGTNNNQIRNIIIIVVIGLVMVVGMNMLLSSFQAAQIKQISYDVFVSYLEKGYIDTVEIEDDRLYFNLTDRGVEQYVEKPAEELDERRQRAYDMAVQATKNQTFLVALVDDPGLTDRLLKADVTIDRVLAQQMSPLLSIFLTWILPMLLIYGVLMLLFRHVNKRQSSGAMSFGKNTAKIYGEKETGVTFVDVAGQDEAKESLTEIIDYLKNPARYSAIGAKLPKGALLVGPPGTGKTLLAKAVAGEAGVPFFALSGSDFVEMFVGVGASRVRDLFKQAMEKAPCIVFIDEIDAIGKSRGASAITGGNDEREQTLNQLLAEMDGFDSSKGVVILAATNRPEVLDPALLRPGRFDRRIIVDKPDMRGRLAILEVHARGVKMDPSVDLSRIARATPGAVGADLANIINEAALHAVSHGRETVTQTDLMESVETVIAGKEKKDRILSAEEKNLVAVHEAGHAIVALALDGNMPVQKITIVPRTMGSLGYTLQVEEDERFLHTKQDLLNRLTTLLGGRAAEELVVGKTTTGAANDIERATEIAQAMVTQYGMSEQFGMVKLADQNNIYLGGRMEMTCSPETAAKVDEEVRSIISDAFQRATGILEDNRARLSRVTDVLVEKETLNGEEFMELVEEADLAGSQLPAGDVESDTESE